jgi:glycosyltransferase involved in cell wall biosynthesis
VIILKHMKTARFALLSHVMPPSPSGQAVILYRILSGVESKQYYLIDSSPASSLDLKENCQNFYLKSKYYSLPKERMLVYTKIAGLSLILNICNFFVQVVTRAKHILEILEQEHHTLSIVACSGDLVNIPAAFLASRFKRISLYIYMFDDYVFQWTGWERWIAKLIAQFMFKRSVGVICPNEFLYEKYHQRYDILPTLIRNACDENELNKKNDSPWPVESNKIKIIYTGAIYHANHDCFRNLLKAMDILLKYPLELHIYTAQTSDQLRVQGIVGNKIVVHSHTPYDEILKQQRQADILFLPLAFVSSIPEVIQTSAPGKLGEYLASGRPILAHVPANSFVAYYFNKYQCGFLADISNPLSLSEEIKKIITSDDLRNQVTQRAMKQAQIDFSPKIAREQFLAILHKTTKLVMEK